MNAAPAGEVRPAAGLEALLAAQARRRRRGWLWAVPLLALAAAGAAYLVLRVERETAAPGYVTEAARVGDLVVTVSATGKLEPTNQVDLGSEMSGTVAAVLVDEDDRVTRGQVLAELDLATFQDAVAQAAAAVAAAQAGREQAQATLKETQVKIARYREVSRLSGGKVPSKTEMETAEAGLARAQADLTSAQARIAEAQARLRTAETNLSRARIRSPIDGVVLSREVDPGQAVAASLQAVTLFTLAEDLTEMELKVDVDEADVGLVKPGLEVSFTVDAWPDRRFAAEILRVGFKATDSEGVVSYPAVLKVDNADLSLRPGMTGTAEITTLRRQDVLLVPNAALRYTPPEETAAEPSSRGVFGSLLPRMPPRTAKPIAPPPAADGSRRLWVLREGQAVPVQVRTGASDGRHTEVLAGELTPGAQVITERAPAAP